MGGRLTLFDKIWSSHVIDEAYGQALLYVDRHFLHDGSSQSFELLEAKGRTVRASEGSFSTADHYVPTKEPVRQFGEGCENIVSLLAQNSARHGITHFGMGSDRQGIVHVIGPELGLSLPGTIVVCGDSHTSTHGAMGAFAFGIGASEVVHVLATRTIWQTRPKTMRIRVNGVLGPCVTAKDLVLHLIATIGSSGATGHVIEYAGSTISAFSVESRLTLCNMSIEAGAKAGLIAPDEKTFTYLHGCMYAPAGEAWDQAVAHWRTLSSDADCAFNKEVRIDAGSVQPRVTWGTNPEESSEIDGCIPDPMNEPDPRQRARKMEAIEYMGLTAGTRLDSIPINLVFIGSCTNSRIEDLRLAASLVKGRRAIVPSIVVPGSASVKAAAEAEGLAQVFIEAGFEWRNSGCSMCVAVNGVDIVSAGERCAATSNRNFPGRQGRKARTHLMSPAMAAASALTGRITDPRSI